MVQQVVNLNPERQILTKLFEVPAGIAGVSGQVLVANRGGSTLPDVVSVAITTGSDSVDLSNYIAFETPMEYHGILQLQNVTLSPGQKIFVWSFAGLCSFTYTWSTYPLS
jgi:hypothetical protein